MQDGRANECWTRHTWLAGILLLVIMALFGAAVGQSAGKADMADIKDIELRVRSVEERSSRSDERLKRIEDDVRWVRTKLEGS